MTSKRQKLLIQTVSTLFHAQHAVADLFFNHRLAEAIEDIVQSHIQYCAISGDKLRYQQACQAYILAFNNTSSLLEEIMYLKKGDAISLAVAHERVLYYLRDTVREIRNESQENVTIPNELVQSEGPENTSDSKPVRPRGGKLTSTQEKILDFVRRGPERRTKEIIDKFSALSERTVKRGLKELSEEGLIVKKSENRAVYYSVAHA